MQRAKPVCPQPPTAEQVSRMWKLAADSKKRPGKLNVP